MRRVKPHELAGTLVLAPALNLAAVAAMQRGNPHDHWNGDLNRLFPGSPDGNLTQRTAYAYFNSILRQADFVISLHSGASYILWSHEVLTSARDAKSLALAQALGRDWDVVRYTDGFAGSCSAACHDAGITAISIEVGGAAQRSVAEYGLVVDLIVDALLNGLRTLGMLDGEASAAERWILVEDEAIRSSISGFVVFEDRLRLRCEVQRGETLAKLYNAHGVELQAIAAPFDGLLMGMRTYTYAPAGWPLVWLARPTKTITRTL
jgi:predicted deacylase